MVYLRVYKGVIDDIRNMLEIGPPGRRPHEGLVKLHERFESLSPDNRDIVDAIVGEAVFSAVFGLLVVLDGVHGGYPVEGKLSDFALYLQTYSDERSWEADTPNLSVRVNPIVGDLHDQFREMVEERTEGS